MNDLYFIIIMCMMVYVCLATIALCVVVKKLSEHISAGYEKYFKLVEALEAERIAQLPKGDQWKPNTKPPELKRSTDLY